MPDQTIQSSEYNGSGASAPVNSSSFEKSGMARADGEDGEMILRRRRVGGGRRFGLEKGGEGGMLALQHSVSSTSISKRNAPHHSGFLRLPIEVRLDIYRMLLTTPFAFNGKAAERRLTRRNGPCVYELQPNILRTNRQIYHEAIAILMEENIWITTTINIPDWPCGCFPNALSVVSRKSWPKALRPALEIQITLPRTQECTQRTQQTNVIMSPESIPSFVFQLWLLSVGNAAFARSALDLVLHASDRHSLRILQDICYVTFASIRINGRISLHGDGQLWFYQLLVRTINCPFKSVDMIISTAQIWLTATENALRAGDPEAAYSHFTCAKVFYAQAMQSLRRAVMPNLGQLTQADRHRKRHFESALECRATSLLLRLGYYQAIVAIKDLFCHTPEQEIMMTVYIWRAYRFLGEKREAIAVLEESLPDSQLSSRTWVLGVAAAMTALYPDKPDLGCLEMVEALAEVIEHRLRCRECEG